MENERQTDHLFKLFLDAMAEELQQDRRGFLNELGSFDVITKQSREVYHPVTGKPIKPPKIIHFQYGLDGGMDYCNTKLSMECSTIPGFDRLSLTGHTEPA